MNYSKIYWQDVINGDGLRISIFVSGCTIHCKGCFNTSAWNFNSGIPFTEDIIDEILFKISDPDIKYSGISILGGEPLDNIEGLLPFLIKFKKEREKLKDNKDVWIWTGYTIDEIRKDYKKMNLLKYCNYAVVGPFIEEEKDLTLRYRGSKNQKIYRINDVSGKMYFSDIENLKIGKWVTNDFDYINDKLVYGNKSFKSSDEFIKHCKFIQHSIQYTVEDMIKYLETSIWLKDEFNKQLASELYEEHKGKVLEIIIDNLTKNKKKYEKKSMEEANKKFMKKISCKAYTNDFRNPENYITCYTNGFYILRVVDTLVFSYINNIRKKENEIYLKQLHNS